MPHVFPRAGIFLHDVLMIPAAWFGAYWLRFNLDTLPDDFTDAAWQTLPWVVGVQALIYWCLGLHRGVWRFSSLPDMTRLVQAVSLGILAIAVVLFLSNRLAGVPRAVILLYPLLLLLLLGVPRFAYRLAREHTLMPHAGKRALIVGAGAAGDLLARDLLSSKDSPYWPVVFVDDDPAKRKRDIRGLRVAGTTADIPAVIARWQIEVILIAIPSATDEQMRRIIEICEQCDLPFQTLPSVKELLAGDVGLSKLRDVSIEDILGREPVRLAWPVIETQLRGKTILVTGGGGSIGSELCLQLLKARPAGLVVFDQSEFNLYQIDRTSRAQALDMPLHALLGDVTDRAAVRQVFERFRPQVVFHAAAYKHVPLLETQLREALHNNVHGTRVVAEEAMRSGVERFVLISTDKAVNPVNVMGASKRAAEKLCQHFNRLGTTRFITVRFGNVLDSAGSVVPLFREQIKAGGPVTVTHPDITRYFMTIPEACQLIMQAAAVGQGGEVFVLDMGKPIKIAYLAEQMIRLSGKRPGIDIRIDYIGLRPGEKLYEELFYASEPLQTTPYEKLLLAQAQTAAPPLSAQALDALERACAHTDTQQLSAILHQWVPEYRATP